MISLLILFGGVSTEHTVSCASASSVVSFIDKSKYTLYTVGITRCGKWLLTPAIPEDIKSGSWESNAENAPVTLSLDRTRKGLWVFDSESTVSLKTIDCVIPILHGKNGEDGTVQGLCELAGLPFVGPGVCASATAMDKTASKLIAASTGVRQADYCVVWDYIYKSDPLTVISDLLTHFGNKFPLFVKPASAGSSVGVSKASNEQILRDAIELGLKYDQKVLVEEAITGREVQVAVLGNTEPKASVVAEVVLNCNFNDFYAKYRSTVPHKFMPANIPSEAASLLKEYALKIYRAFNCRGLSRVDFFLVDNVEPVFNEINTIPGFTADSLYPMLWKTTGIPFRQLVDTLIDLAIVEYKSNEKYSCEFNG